MLKMPLLYIGSDSDSIAKVSHLIHQLTVVENEAEALKELSSRPYEGVIVDATLSFASALDLIERISIVKKLLLSLIITISQEPENLLRAIRLGITDVLASPMDSNELETTLKRLSFALTKQRQLAQKTSLLNQYKNAIDTSLFLIRTDTEGNIIYANDKYNDLTGYTPHEIIGQTHRLFKHPNTSKEQIRDLWATIQSKKVWHGTMSNLTKEGKSFYTDTYIVPILNENNEIEQYLDMRTDITEIKNYLSLVQQRVDEATQEIQNQQQQLFVQSRAAALGEMFDNIAHQWRQPIGAINNAIINAEFALELGNMELSDVHKTFEQINSYTAFLSKTIDDFRNFSHADNESTVFTLHDIITQTIGIIQGAYKMHSISLIYADNEETQGLQVEGPRGELSQVLLNVLGNARDAIAEKGVREGKVSIRLHPLTDSVTIDIADNGGGIPETVLPKIFDPYFTTKTKNQGTGIGLYMSKTIIETHYGGKIEAKNSEEGAMFTITLPRAQKS